MIKLQKSLTVFGRTTTFLAANGVSDLLDLNIFRGDMPPDLLIMPSQKFICNGQIFPCIRPWLHMRNITKIKNCLPRSDVETLVHAFITTKLDNCNSLLFGLPRYLIDRLQRIQNSAARLITGSRKYEHITPILKQLHWLPIDMSVSNIKSCF